MENQQKLRVYWIPQIGAGATFYVPVKTVEEAYRVMATLAAYDCFQYENKIKPDYCNTGGLEMWDEELRDWVSWETEDYDDVDEFCEEASREKEDLAEFNREMFSQVKFTD